MVREDPYKVLGVRADASPAALKRAYLRLAKRLHPDLNPSREAHETFLAVKEAYETLSSPLPRREYDERRARSPPAVWQTPPPIHRARVIRVTVPYAAKEARAVRIRTVSDDRRRRQLSFAYTAMTSGLSVVFLAGSFLLVALGGLVPGVVSFVMGVVLILLLFHVIPFFRPR